jgi:hypothetical protein
VQKEKKMSRNGSGTYNLPAGNPVVTGTTISSTWANTTLSDMANAITGSIAADGQTTITGALKGPNGTVAFAGVGQTKIPSGTTAQRAASPEDGMIRYNTDLQQYEGYKNGAWSIFGNGAGGTLFSDTVTATQGQTVINMPTGYVLGGDNLSVYVNGSRQIYNVNYTETTTTSFTFINGLNDGDLVNYTIGASTSLSVNAASVLYNEGSTSAIDQNVEQKLQQYVSVKDFGAVADGVTNDSAAFQSAIDTGKAVYVPSGTYKLNVALSTTGNLNLYGDGENTVLDFTGTITGGSYAIEATGSLTQIQDLGSNVALGDYELTFATAPSLSSDDVFVIYNPTASSWSGFRTYYNAGEWCEADTVSGSTVSLKNQTYDSYTTTAVDVYKLSSSIVSLKNFKIIGTTVLGLINIALSKNIVIENIIAYNENNSCISFDRCYSSKIVNCTVNNYGDGGDDYGIAIGNSQDIQINGGFAFARRHGITIGGGNSTGNVTNRNVRVRNMTIKNDLASAGIYSADMHGNTEDSSYENCNIYGGITWQGKDNSYINCTITATSTGFVEYAAEIKGGYFKIEGCELKTFKDPQLIARGIIDIGGNNNAVTANTTLATTFIVKNCTLFGKNLNTITSFVLFKNNGTTQNINFDIQNINANVDNCGIVLYTKNNSGTAASEYIIVDAITNFPNGATLHAATGGAYLNFPHRMQKQTAIEPITTSTSVSVISGTPTTFRYFYPRNPSVITGVNNQTYIGAIVPVSTADPISFDGLTVQYATPDGSNFAAAVSSIQVSWSASINEI